MDGFGVATAATILSQERGIQVKIRSNQRYRLGQQLDMGNVFEAKYILRLLF